MWASWASETRERAGAVAGRIALATALLVLSAVAAAATVDTGRVVRHVRIGPAGINIESYDSDSTDSAHVSASPRHGGVIRVGRHGITIVDGQGDKGGDDTVVVGGDGGSVVVNAGDAGLVRVFADASVRPGEVIPGDVVAVFGSADVRGQVEGDVVAVFGSVRLHPGATVQGDAIAIGGVLDHPPGAHVGGESVALGLMTPGWNAPTLATLLAGVLLGWLATVILGWLLAMLFPERMRAIGATASRHTAGSLFLGLVSAPLFVIAMVLLCVTVIGIPFAVLLPFAYLLAVWAGQIAASYVLGCRILRRRPGEGGLMAGILAGTLLVSLLFVLGAVFAIPEGLARTASVFFTLLGMLMIVGLSTIGTGALILSRIGSRGPQPQGAPVSAAGPEYAGPTGAAGTAV
jgi:hypothetical protein